MPGFCPSDWMKAPMAYCAISPILSFNCANLAGGNRASNHSWYVSKSNSGAPTRKFERPEPRNGESQLSALSRLRSKTSTFGDLGATRPHPKMPIRRRSVMARRIVAQGICIDPRRGSGEKNDDAARSRAFGMRLQKRASPRRRAATADRDDRPRRGTARPERHRRRHDADGRGRRQPVGRGGRDGGGAAAREGAGEEARKEEALMKCSEAVKKCGADFSPRGRDESRPTFLHSL